MKSTSELSGLAIPFEALGPSFSHTANGDLNQLSPSTLVCAMVRSPGALSCKAPGKGHLVWSGPGDWDLLWTGGSEI